MLALQGLKFDAPAAATSVFLDEVLCHHMALPGFIV